MSLDRENAARRERGAQPRPGRINLGVVIGVLLFVAAIAAVSFGLWLGRQ